MRAVQDLCLTMAIGLCVNGFDTIVADDAMNLLGDDVERLVPRDALVSAHATRLRMAFAFGIPINTLHRIQDAVLGIDALLVCKLHGCQRSLRTWLKHLVINDNLPRIQSIQTACTIKVIGTDARNLALVFGHIHIADV